MSLSYDGGLLGHLAEHMLYLSTASLFWLSLDSSYDHEFHLSRRLGIFIGIGLLSRLSSRCPLILSSRRHLVFSPRLSSSSRCTALSSSHCAGWLLLRRLSARRHLVLSSSSHCAALLPSHRAVWLLRRLSSCCRLVLSSSSHCATLLSSNRAGWLLRHLSSRRRLVFSSHCTLVLLSSSHCSSHHLVVALTLVAPSSCPLVVLSLPTTLAAPATMAVVVPRHPGHRTLSLGWATPSRHRCPHHRPGCCFLPSNLVPVLAIALAAIANARFVARHPRPTLSPSPSPSSSSLPSPLLARHHCRRCHSLFVADHHHHRHHCPCHPHPCPLRRPPASSP